MCFYMLSYGSFCCILVLGVCSSVCLSMINVCEIDCKHFHVLPTYFTLSLAITTDECRRPTQIFTIYDKHEKSTMDHNKIKKNVLMYEKHNCWSCKIVTTRAGQSLAPGT